MDNFSAARRRAIAVAEEMGHEKVVPRDPTATHQELVDWIRSRRALAWHSGQAELLLAVEDYARELGVELQPL